MTRNLGVERAFGNSYTFEVRYMGTKGIHLWNQTRLNGLSKVSDQVYLPTFMTMPSPAAFAGLTTTLGQISARPNNSYEDFGFSNYLVAYAPHGHSSYNGMATQLTKRFSNNLSFVAAYTWSHLEDDSTATNFSTYLTPRRAQDFQNMRAEWASSALDHRHRFTFTPVYDVKFFANHNWFLKNVTSNWNIAGTYTYESPEYATVQSGVDSNLNDDSAGDRAVINPLGAANAGTGVTGYDATAHMVPDGDASTVAYVANRANARYVVAGQGALANGGRNTFPLSPTNNIDLSLTKRFNFTERTRLEFGSQVFNLLNHAQFTGGYLSDVSPNSYTAARNDLIPDDGLFGRFDQFYSSNCASFRSSPELFSSSIPIKERRP